MADGRRYAGLLVKGEERRRLILEVAQRLLVRQGWRSTAISQIAREAGVSSAGVLHHFPSKEHLLNAVLDARDADDMAHADFSLDTLEQLANVARRFERSPDLIGSFIVILIENLGLDDPLHERVYKRHRVGARLIADSIRQGQRSGRYRTDVDPVVKAAEIQAFLNGMETSWLLDPSIPVTEVFREYTRALKASLAPTGAGG